MSLPDTITLTITDETWDNAIAAMEVHHDPIGHCLFATALQELYPKTRVCVGMAFATLDEGVGYFDERIDYSIPYDGQVLIAAFCNRNHSDAVYPTLPQTFELTKTDNPYYSRGQRH